MGTKIEYFVETPDGLMRDNRFDPSILHNDSTFFDYCTINNEECLAEIADEDGETSVNIFRNDLGEPESIQLSLPGESFEFRLMDENPEPEPTRIVSIVHTQETPAKGSFVFSMN